MGTQGRGPHFGVEGMRRDSRRGMLEPKPEGQAENEGICVPGERIAKEREYAKVGTLQITGFGQSIDCIWAWWDVAVCRANIPPFPIFSLALQLPEVMSILQFF